MKTSDLINIGGFSVCVAGSEKIVESVYCADLLSWAMARAPEGSAWCTVMGNTNAVAVASLTEVACIILCEGAVLDEIAAKKAAEEGIYIFKTKLPAFEAGRAIAKCGSF